MNVSHKKRWHHKLRLPYRTMVSCKNKLPPKIRLHELYSLPVLSIVLLLSKGLLSNYLGYPTIFQF